MSSNSSIVKTVQEKLIALGVMAKSIFVKVKQMSQLKLLTLSVVITSFIGITSFVIYSSEALPYMSASISAPGLTKDMTPDDISIDLDIPYSRNGYPSAMPLGMLDKTITKGISITPAIAGSWSWENERTITFSPKQDWPANQEYTVHIDPSVFAKKSLKLSSNNLYFRTPPFTVGIKSLTLEKDPKNSKQHNVFSTLHFSHAVNKQSLVENVHLTVSESSQQIPFTITYDNNFKTAYIKSEQISIPDEEYYIHLEVDENVFSELGKSKLDEKTGDKVLIPDIYSFFKVKDIDYQIVTNQKAEPEQILHIGFTDSIDKEEFLKRVSFMHQKVSKDATKAPFISFIPQLKGSDDQFSTDYFITTSFDGKGYVKVILEKGLSSINGFRTRREITEIKAVPRYPRKLAIMGKGSLLASSGEKKVSFVSRGVSSFEVTIKKLFDNQMNHLISQTYGDLTSPTFINYQFDADNITENKLTKLIRLTNSHPKNLNYSSLDLSTYMKDQGSGVFFIKIQDKEHYLSDKRMIVVTDLGLVVKKAADGSRDVFVESIHSGRAIDGAAVSILGKNGLTVQKSKTNERGKASFVNLDSLENEQTPTVIVAKYGKDTSFIPYTGFSRQINYSSFDVGGITNNKKSHAKTLTAFAFSDRGIYRPGDTVHIGTIVKQGNFEIDPSLSVTVKINDARNKTILEKRVSLKKSGFFELDLATRGSSSTGEYNYNVYLNDKDETFLGSMSFSVEEFQADTMKIKTKILPFVSQGWVQPKGLKATVSLANLYGSPAQNRNIQAQAEVKPIQFQFAKYSDYSFSSAYQDKKPKSLNFEDQKTDKQGEASYEIVLPDYTAGTYELKFSAQGYEADGGRSVFAKSSTFVSPAKWLVGTKTDGELTYLKKNQDRSVTFIAIDANLAQISQNSLTLEHINNQRLSVLTKQRNGTYRYETVIKDKLLSSENFNIGAKGSTYKLVTSNGGDYTLNLKDKTGAVLTSMKYHVVVQGNESGALEKNAELQLALDKKIYANGETIQMNILAPYVGSGLITIETDKVHAHKWFKTNSKGTIQHIKVPEGLEGNAYVNVTFVRSVASKEVFTSPLSYAVKPFNINRNKRMVDISLEVPHLVKPGETLNINYHTDKKSKIVIYAVDEGILQVAKYKLPKPLLHFLKKTALAVETFQILDLVLPEYSRFIELAGIGGGSSENKLEDGANLNPFKRTLDVPAVYWSGIIDADTKDRNVSFNVPDSFSGSLKVMAVAVAEGAMGSASDQTLVRGPFVLTPNVLTVAAPGDIFDATVNVANGIKGSKEHALVDVSMELSDNLQVIGKEKQQLKISEGDEAKVSFKIKVLDRLGEGKITFAAKHKNEALKRVATLSIRPVQTLTTTVEAKYVKASALHEVDVKRELYNEYARQTIAASSSPFLMVSGMTDFLEAYPHGCTEQIISQAFPWIGLSSTKEYQLYKVKSDEKVKQVIQRLQGRQLSDGGFGLWPTSSNSSKFASLYTMHFLTEIHDMNSDVTIPKNLFEGGMDYLRSIAREDATSLSAARLRAIAIYLLIRNKEIATNYLVDLHDTMIKNHTSWESDIISSYIAASYKMLLKEQKALEMIEKFDPSSTVGYTDFQSDLTMNAQHVYLVSKHFIEKKLSVKESILPLLKPVMESRLNTISASYTVLALSAYTNRNNVLYANNTLNFFTLGKTKTELPKAELKPFEFAHIPLNTKKVGIASKNPLFYQLVQSGFNKTVNKEAVSQGLEVYKEYVDKDGKEIANFTQGQEVTVNIRIRTTDQNSVPNIVLVDLLPGGFEVIRESVSRNSQESWSADYIDIREDRIVYYAGFSKSFTQLSYKVKVTASGTFMVPSASATSMYDSKIHAHTLSSMITVSPAK